MELADFFKELAQILKTDPRMVGLFLLTAFLPLLAVAYYFFRRPRRIAEINRVLKILNIDRDSLGEPTGFDDRREWIYYALAVLFFTVISMLGLAILLFGAEFNISDKPDILLGGSRFISEQGDSGNIAYQKGAMLVLGMAFLGAYVWGTQNIMRRYFLNDLVPGVYFSLAVRMIYSAAVALIIYHGYDALAGSTSGSQNSNIWPAFAFLLGMFPQRGLDWVMDRVPIFSSKQDPSVPPLPLDMIEGITPDDRIRLREAGIDNCYRLATHDFIPLVLTTPYGARELRDWLLQAKLCVHFGEAAKNLRQYGIRKITDLQYLDDTTIGNLARETPLTEFRLKMVKMVAEKQEAADIERLTEVGIKLDRYWYGDNQDEDSSSH